MQEPHLFVVCRQLRTAPKAVTRQQFYYILDGSVYQAPSLHAAMASRIVSRLPFILKNASYGINNRGCDSTCILFLEAHPPARGGHRADCVTQSGLVTLLYC